MHTKIEFNNSYALLTVELDQGEEIKAEPGAMVAQQNVKMDTGASVSGVLSGFKRVMGGESLFINTFTGQQGGGYVCLAPPAPGDIGMMQLEPGRNLFIQASSFLACGDNVDLDSKFQGFRGFFSGESMFFIRASTDESPGYVFYNSYGAIKEIPVEPGVELVVDTGHLVAFTDEVKYGIGKVGGLRSLVAGGEGLVMKFNGDGHVWIQTRNLQSLAEKIFPLLPRQKGR